MTSATDELRRMLDERGVEWIPIAWNPKRETFYHTSNGVGFCAGEYAEGVKIYTDATITPAQAIEATLGPQVQPPSMPEQPPYDVLIDLLRDEWDINVMWDGLRRFWYVGLTDEGVRKRDEREATLGRGTCHRALDFDGTRYVCSACGENFGPSRWHFCPNCGRKVVGA